VAAQAAALLAHHRARLRAGVSTEADEFLLRTTIKDRLCWDWTLAHGGAAFTRHAKFLAVPLWSTRALRSFAKYGRVEMRNGVADALRHEHVVPRDVIAGELLALAEPTEPTVREVLERRGIACVVTVEEDRRLTARAFDPADPWRRYAEAGVEVVALRAD
jgi:hypothetical protein